MSTNEAARAKLADGTMSARERFGRCYGPAHWNTTDLFGLAGSLLAQYI